MTKARLPRPMRTVMPATPPAKPAKIMPLRKLFEQIDSATASKNLTEAMIAAAWTARMCEHGWRVGNVMLVGRLSGSDEMAVIERDCRKFWGQAAIAIGG